MNKVTKIVGLLSLFAVSTVYSACDNACSGHGTCGADDVCNCYANYRMGDEDGGDCSDRVCPYDIAWVDHPDENGLFHNYAECSNRGVCNRGSGECECFEGYTGKACQRTSCPNDCSGHGTCEYIEELGFGSSIGDYFDGSSAGKKKIGQRAVTFGDTKIWDNHKTMMCVCDPKWTDLDCSRRMCPKGNDVMNTRLNGADTLDYQIQTIALEAPDDQYGSSTSQFTFFDDASFALTFVSTLNETYTTRPIKLEGGTDSSGVFDSASCTTFAGYVESALEELPHRVVDDVDVSATSTGNVLSFIVTFSGEAVQGKQNLLIVEDYACADGCTPKMSGIDLITDTTPGSYVTQTQAADYNNYECGRRGKCNYGTGLCECFDGYTGEACATQTALI